MLLGQFVGLLLRGALLAILPAVTTADPIAVTVLLAALRVTVVPVARLLAVAIAVEASAVVTVAVVDAQLLADVRSEAGGRI